MATGEMLSRPASVAGGDDATAVSHRSSTSRRPASMAAAKTPRTQPPLHPPSPHFSLPSSHPGQIAVTSSSHPPHANSTAISYAAHFANQPYPSPLPLLHLAPPQIASSLRASLLQRRRSSFPPASSPSTAALQWIVSNTPLVPTLEIKPDCAFAPGGNSAAVAGASGGGGGGEGGGGGVSMAWTPSSSWEGLLNFDQPANNQNITSDTNTAPSKPDVQPISASVLDRQPISRDASDPGMPESRLHQQQSLSPAQSLQTGSDIVWKTILGSVVDVEGVGEVGVARVLQEVWKRGGGDAVTGQALWPTIIIALSLSSAASTSSGSPRIPTPSPQAASALENLYNLTLRHWEPSIFSGLLSRYISSQASAPFAEAEGDHRRRSVYGAATPTKGTAPPDDLSLWMNLTPGVDLVNLLATSSSGFTPRGSVSHHHPSSSLAHELNPFEFRRQSVDQHDMRNSREQLNDGKVEEEEVRGLDEILDQMEAEQVEHGQAEMARQASMDKGKTVPPSRNNSTFQLPTPETEASGSPAMRHQQARKHALTNVGGGAVAPEAEGAFDFSPPESMCSPFVTASSTSTASKVIPWSSASSSSATVVASQTSPRQRAPHPTCLTLPTSSFVPPPPMCMFFNPSFRDLQKDKVGIWKGDLALRGAGGWKGGVLIVGEESMGYIWQSHLWPGAIDYPQPANPDLSVSCTSTMIPVAHLAREGFTPVAMGMVLCTDPDIQGFVRFVQGLHAEGVAFHLPNLSRLPIVFLPAKFDTSDTLQRLGIAFMSKPGMLPPPPPPPPLAAATTTKEGAAEDQQPRKKRRRQSAPAKAQGLGRSRRGDSPSIGGRGRVDEDVIAEEDLR